MSFTAIPFALPTSWFELLSALHQSSPAYLLVNHTVKVKKTKRFNRMMKISNHKVFLNIRNVIINAAILQSLKAGRIRKQVSIIHESIQNLIENKRSFRDADH